MAAPIIFTLLLGIIIGLLWTFFNLWLFFRLAKIKCPSCKQLKPLRQIFVFTGWKTRTITGQPCLKCQKPQPPIEIDIY